MLKQSKPRFRKIIYDRVSQLETIWSLVGLKDIPRGPLLEVQYTRSHVTRLRDQKVRGDGTFGKGLEILLNFEIKTHLHHYR